jgi:periplasmic divalent cation tolerance protein
MQTFFIYITTQDKAQAREIGRYLVQSHLAACVNILDNMNSMYIWQGEFQDDQEAVLIAKTTEAKVPELIEAVKSRHSYEVPCIVCLRIVNGNPDFLHWISGQVAGPST